MKKDLIIIMMIFFLTGCSSSTAKIEKVEYVEDSDRIIKMPTYKFTGISEHFAFQTGVVEYNDNNEKALVIKNFKLNKKMNNVEKYYLIIAFNDVTIVSKDYISLNGNFEEKLKEITIAERGTLEFENGVPVGENDSFMLTEKENFKDSIKIGINYCYSNNKCKDEYLDLDFINE